MTPGHSLLRKKKFASGGQPANSGMMFFIGFDKRKRMGY